MVVTPDGCPVEVYASLPPEPELSAVLELCTVPTGRVLDLGAGAGRIADPLAERGFDVLAVDESAEMLDQVRSARTHRSRIESLALDEQFDVALLLSHLINVPKPSQRRDLLRVVARHLAPDGIAIIQRHDPTSRFAPGWVKLGPVEVGLTDVDTARWPEVAAVTHYRTANGAWAQAWHADVLDDDATTAEIQAVGLQPHSLTGKWVTARHA